MKAFKYGNVRFRSRSAAARFYLKRTTLSQTAIAKRLHVSVPCVCQIAAEVR
jgi:hypothetical protein